MKMTYKVISLGILFMLISFFAQSQPIPGHESSGGAIAGGPIGGGVPIGNATGLLLVLASAYGVYRLYRGHNKVTVSE